MIPTQVVGQYHSGGAGLLTLARIRIKAKPENWIKRQGTIMIMVVKTAIREVFKKTRSRRNSVKGP